jgi:hypothetical protein
MIHIHVYPKTEPVFTTPYVVSVLCSIVWGEKWSCVVDIGMIVEVLFISV